MLPRRVVGFLTWFPMLALAVLAGIFVWRRLYRELPLFFAYLVSASLLGVLRHVTLYIGGKIYFYSYWISDLAGSVIFLLVFYEILLRRLFPKFYKVKFYRNLFPIIALIVLAGTIVTAVQFPNKGAAFQTISRSLDFMRTAALTFLMLLMVVMGRNWTRHDFGIALGFGVQAAVTLTSSAARALLNRDSRIFVDLGFIAYNAACVIWLITFWKPERQPGPPTDSLLNQETLLQAKKWEATLKDFLTTDKKLL